VPASEISMYGRVARGVRIMKVSDGNSVVTFTRAEPETPEEPDSDSDSESVESSPQSEEFNSDSNEEVTI